MHYAIEKNGRLRWVYRYTVVSGQVRPFKVMRKPLNLKAEALFRAGIPDRVTIIRNTTTA